MSRKYPNRPKWWTAADERADRQMTDQIDELRSALGQSGLETAVGTLVDEGGMSVAGALDHLHQSLRSA